MEIKKTLITAFACMTAFASTSMADAKSDEYIKTFGMIMFANNNLGELNLTDEEFAKFVEGMKAIKDGGSVPENLQEIGAPMLEYLQARAEGNIAKEAEKTAAAADVFWKELEKNDKINKTPSGLAYEIIQEGVAPFPTENSDVVVNYKGTLTDGKVFDSTERSGKPAEFNLSRVIPGFREGLQKVGKGGKARLYIPAKLGYGTQPIPGIPPNSTLIFDVEIVDVDPNGVPAAMPAAE